MTSYTLFDGLGRQVQTQTPADGDGAKISDTAYDGDGQVVSTNNPYWAEIDAAGNVVVPSGSLFVPVSQQQIPSRTLTTYDGLGRVTASTLQSYGNNKYFTKTVYNRADRIDVTPPVGGIPTTTLTNTQGKTSRLTQYELQSIMPNPSAGTTVTTSYAYDPRGDMTSMSDPAGNNWSWTFDALGRNSGALDPDTGLTTTAYDDANRVTSTTDARGQVLAYTYNNLDPVNRKTGEYSGSTKGPKLAAWAYDTLSKGQPTSSTSYVGSTASTVGVAYTEAVTGYDVGDQPSGTTITLPANTMTGALAGTYTTSVAYNAAEQVVSQADPAEGGLAAESLYSDYDQFGDVTGLHGAGNYLNAAIYSPIFQLKQYASSTSSTSLFSTYSTDQATGRVADIRNTELFSGGYSTVADHAYTYDDSGNVTSETTSADSVATDTQCFYYQLQALIDAWTPASGSCAGGFSATGGPAPYATVYGVDSATGNRVNIAQLTPAGAVTSGATYTYPGAGSAHPHAVSSINNFSSTASTGSTTATYSYDADVGDLVLATDPETGKTKAEPVVQLIRHSGTYAMVLISLADGSVLDSTDGHPIWDATTGQFTDARGLHVGDKIETTNGSLITIAGLITHSADLTAYNLQIDQIHTYYAGTTPVLVHNSCDPLSPNQMNRAIQRGQAPRGITRIDTPKVPNEELHATFEDGSALNIDGTWKHGGVTLTRAQASWLEQNGWTLP